MGESKSSRYYKTGSTKKGKGNPAKAAAARKKKAATDKKVNAKPEQKKKRAELGRENYKRDKANGGKSHRAGKDLGHQKNGTLKYESVKANRGKKGEGGRKKKK